MCMREVENWVCMRKGHMDLTWAPLTRAREGSLALGPGRRIRAIWCSLQEDASRVRALHCADDGEAFGSHLRR